MGRRSAAWGVGLLVAGLRVCGGDWPQFRGPGGEGHSVARGVPLHWSASSNVVWKTVVPGSGWSSPVLQDGRIYLTTAVPQGGDDAGQATERSLRALCLDAGTGQVRWDVEVFRQEAGAPGIHSKNGHASPTPIAAGDRIFVHFGHQGTACLNRAGEIVWRQRSLKYAPVHGNGGSPVLVNDLLVFSADGGQDPFVAALSQADGSVRWKTPRQTTAAKKFSFSTPQVIEVKGRKQVISPGSGMVGAYDPEDGREIWRARYGEGYSVIARPVYAHGLLFVSSSYDRPVVYAVRPEGSGDVTETHVAWTASRGAPNTPSMLVVGDELYFVSDAGIASCVDARTGRVHWSERLGGGFSASPVHADGRIYFQNEAGLGVVIRPGTKFEKLAENDLGERTLASYAVDDGALFIRTAGHLYRIGSGR